MIVEPSTIDDRLPLYLCSAEFSRPDESIEISLTMMNNNSTSLDWLLRGTVEIFPDRPPNRSSTESAQQQENLGALLEQVQRPLRVKLGIDPTGTDIHLGHSIPFRKLRAFQDAGHKAVLIIGDFTARIGDPTGKSEVRKQLTDEQVKANAQTYLAQLQPVLDFAPDRLEVRYNSEWLSSLDLGKILELLSTMTVGQMLAKEGFANRYTQENPIFLHEFLYPLMQGYDSVAVQADVEIGGTDQKFNLAVGRDLQKHFGQQPQFGLLMPILLGTDGIQKMSKSLHNYVGMNEDALSMYAKLEKTPDSIIQDYFTLLTDLPLDQIPSNPRDAQKLLATTIVSQYHGAAAAASAQQDSIALVGGGAVAGDSIPEFNLTEAEFPLRVFQLLAMSGLCSGSNDAKRQIQGGAVKIDGSAISDIDLIFDTAAELQGKVLQVGKKRFRRLC
jgi:tyrosyl-tRNA synthetase